MTSIAQDRERRAASRGGPSTRTRGVFASYLRQELRSPASAVASFSTMLVEDAAGLADEGFRADLDKIHGAAHELLARVDALLDPKGTGAAPVTGDETFASSVRHELRTPLNHVIGYGEMLAEDAPGLGCERFLPDLERLLAAARRMLGQLEDVLALPRLEAQPGAAPTPWGLSIGHVAAALAPLADPARGARAAPGKVLVVDDNEMNREVLVRRLERQGHAVAAAVDGEEALARLAAADFDLVLLDMLMPRLNGYEVLERMKASERLRELPVIMITALDETASVARCLEMGAEDYLTKPFSPVVLDARVGACLEKKHLRDREVLHLRQIEEEKQRTERLLRVILPEEIIHELRETRRVRCRRHADVAVLFADVVGFTSYCDRHDADELVAALQQLVEGFEEIAERHGLEKIKTIGDAFMATAGLLERSDNPVLACVTAGLEMVPWCASLPAGWQVRVGIHCGEVIAGVVGHKKYQFDVWGDTVNTASRVESNGVPGAVSLSAEAWQQVSHLCRGRSRGRMPIKGKGEMELFVVEGVSRAEGRPATRREQP